MRLFLPFLFAAAVVAAAEPSSALSRLAVYVEHAARLPVQGSVGSVMVGNPAVADVVVVDRHTVYVQGKGFGQTEVVVLDTEGRTLWQGDVAVFASDEGRVSVIRGPSGAQGAGASGAHVTELTCAGRCSASGQAGKSASASGAPSLNIGK